MARLGTNQRTSTIFIYAEALQLSQATNCFTSSIQVVVDGSLARDVQQRPIFSCTVLKHGNQFQSRGYIIRRRDIRIPS